MAGVDRDPKTTQEPRFPFHPLAKLQQEYLSPKVNVNTSTGKIVKTFLNHFDFTPALDDTTFHCMTEVLKTVQIKVN